MLFNCHSYYSFRYGTMDPETLVREALKYRIPAVCLADINNTTGMIDFVKAAGKEGLKPVAGIDFRNGDRHLYTCIARNNEGFRELNEFLSFHLLKDIPLPTKPDHFN